MRGKSCPTKTGVALLPLINILFPFYSVITIGLVPDPTLGAPNYQIPENSLSFRFCAQITAGSLAPGRIVVVNLATLEGPPPPVGAQGLYTIHTT